MFITFEGLDYCGKTTQIKLLQSYLESSGKQVSLMREPGGTEISERIRDILLDRKSTGMFDETELLLFNAARAQLVREVIAPKLEKGIYVLSDRFYDSSDAYQGHGRGLDLEKVHNIISFAVGQYRPNLTYFFDIPLDVMAKRKSMLFGEPDRIESTKGDFYERVRKGYLTIARKEPDRFKVVDGTKNIEEIHEIIKKDFI